MPVLMLVVLMLVVLMVVVSDRLERSGGVHGAIVAFSLSSVVGRQSLVVSETSLVTHSLRTTDD
jgi:hypothetical protein